MIFTFRDQHASTPADGGFETLLTFESLDGNTVGSALLITEKPLTDDLKEAVVQIAFAVRA